MGIFGFRKVISGNSNPTIEDLDGIIKESEFSNNISVFDAETGEYYPVTMIGRATPKNDVLDKGHIILVIKQ